MILRYYLFKSVTRWATLSNNTPGFIQACMIGLDMVLFSKNVQTSLNIAVHHQLLRFGLPAAARCCIPPLVVTQYQNYAACGNGIKYTPTIILLPRRPKTWSAAVKILCHLWLPRRRHKSRKQQPDTSTSTSTCVIKFTKSAWEKNQKCC